VEVGGGRRGEYVRIRHGRRGACCSRTAATPNIQRGGVEEQGEREEGRGKEKKTDDKNKYNQQLL